MYVCARWQLPDSLLSWQSGFDRGQALSSFDTVVKLTLDGMDGSLVALVPVPHDLLKFVVIAADELLELFVAESEFGAEIAQLGVDRVYGTRTAFSSERRRSCTMPRSYSTIFFASAILLKVVRTSGG